MWSHPSRDESIPCVYVKAVYQPADCLCLSTPYNHVIVVALGDKLYVLNCTIFDNQLPYFSEDVLPIVSTNPELEPMWI